MKIILTRSVDALKYFLALQEFTVDDNIVFDDGLVIMSLEVLANGNIAAFLPASKLNRIILGRVKEAIKDYEDYSGKEITVFMG